MTEEVKDWLQEFKRRRRELEAQWACSGADQAARRDRRQELIREALALAPLPEIPDLTEIELVAEHLEHGMQLLLDKFDVAGSREQGIGERLSPEKRDELRWLKRNRDLRAERRWIFTGAILEILHQFRESPNSEGIALVKKEFNRLRRQLSGQIEGMRDVLEAAEAYPIVDRFCLQALKGHTDEIHALYRQALGDEAEIEHLLENNGYHLRSQYLRLCMETCLELYGLVSRSALHRLLGLKTAYHLTDPADAALADQGGAEDRKIRRILKKAHERIERRAAKAGWAIQPLLQVSGPRFFGIADGSDD